MAIEIVEMTLADYEAAYALWASTAGVGLSTADSREGIEALLRRNPGLSLVARDDGRLVAAILGSQDGRRGYLHHMAVAPAFRGQGLGKKLAAACLAKLAAIGIQKCHIFLRADNHDGEQFWRRTGWTERTDLKMMSKETPWSGGNDHE